MKLLYVVGGVVAVPLAVLAFSAADAPERPVKKAAGSNQAPRPEAEAVRAAADFLAAMNLETVLNDRARRRLIRASSSPADAARLERIYAAEKDRVSRSYRRGPRFARAALAGYRIDVITENDAAVAIWAAAIGGSRTYEPATAWSTTVVRLRRSDDRWTVRDVRHEAGPSTDWPIRSLAAEGRRFKEFRVAP